MKTITALLMATLIMCPCSSIMAKKSCCLCNRQSAKGINFYH